MGLGLAVFVVGFTWIRSDLVEVGRGGLGCRFPGCVPGCFPGCGPGVFRWFGSRGVRFACGSIWWGRRWRSLRAIARCGGRESACVWACLWWGVLGVQVFNFGGEFGAVCLELQLKLGQVAGCR